MKIDPFKISFPKQEILEIKEKVEIFPWHEMPKEGGWSFGTNIDYMKLSLIHISEPTRR